MRRKRDFLLSIRYVLVLPFYSIVVTVVLLVAAAVMIMWQVFSAPASYIICGGATCVLLFLSTVFYLAAGRANSRLAEQHSFGFGGPLQMVADATSNETSA